jgi:hypothetical protein
LYFGIGIFCRNKDNQFFFGGGELSQPPTSHRIALIDHLPENFGSTKIWFSEKIEKYHVDKNLICNINYNCTGSKDNTSKQFVFSFSLLCKKVGAGRTVPQHPSSAGPSQFLVS